MADLKVASIDGAQCGVQICGLDPNKITDRHVEQIWQAHSDGLGLLCFDFDRLLDAEEQHALTAVFGASEYAPGRITGIGRGAVAGEEELSVAQQAKALRDKGHRSVHDLPRQRQPADACESRTS